MAGTFQDRLVTELRLAGASNIGAANSVLEQFLPRFNRRFQVPPQHPEPAFRPLDPELCLDQILCFKHRRKVVRDNTVRFQLHTLQLLPGPERPSYAGAAVEVLKGLDGRLAVRHEGHIIASQEAPPSPVFLRNGHGRFPSLTVLPSGANGLGEHWPAALEPLDSWHIRHADQPGSWMSPTVELLQALAPAVPENMTVIVLCDRGIASPKLWQQIRDQGWHPGRATDENGHGMITDGVARADKPAATSTRKPTFLQRERWKAIQKARRKGISLRAIERELGIHRSTIRRYLDAEGPWQ